MSANNIKRMAVSVIEKTRKKTVISNRTLPQLIYRQYGFDHHFGKNNIFSEEANFHLHKCIKVLNR